LDGRHRLAGAPGRRHGDDLDRGVAGEEPEELPSAVSRCT
jgi:hypothetical protein